MTRLIAILTLLLVVSTTYNAHGEATLKLGVLAYRPKPLMISQWQPVATYLQATLKRPVNLAVYDHTELADAVKRRTVDVVITTASNFILLKHSCKLSAPLATLVSRVGHHELSAYGGVIVTRSDRSDIASLKDLTGKRIATVSTDAFGGFQMQVYEMIEAGTPLPKADRLLITGQPHDRVIEAVMSGRADAGFVRAGLIESLGRENKIDPARIRIINRQNLPDSPYAVSTRLYPEWPVAVMPHVDKNLASRLAAALYLLPHGSLGGSAAGIHSFTVPADYNVVENLLRRLRLPPFDSPPEFTVADLWRRYAPWIVTLTALLLLLAAASARLVLMNRRSRQSLHQLRHNDAINASRLHLVHFSLTHSLDELLEETLNQAEKLTGSLIGFYHFVEDDQENLMLQNWSTRTKTEFCKAEGKGLHYPIDKAGVWVDCVRQRKAVIHNDYASLPHRKGMPEGHAAVNRELVVPVFRGNNIAAILGIGNKPADYDEKDIETVSLLAELAWEIAERKRVEEALKNSEERFRRLAENARDVIFRMSLPDGSYEYMSPAASELTGYTPTEFYHNPQLLREFVHPDWSGYIEKEWLKILDGEIPATYEFQIIHKKGEVRWVNQRNILVRDEYGRPKAIEGIVTDVTERKKIEEDLRCLNEVLEQRVRERTVELEKKYADLEKMNRMFVGRELRMVELKGRIRELERGGG